MPVWKTGPAVLIFDTRQRTGGEERHMRTLPVQYRGALFLKCIVEFTLSPMFSHQYPELPDSLDGDLLVIFADHPLGECCDGTGPEADIQIPALDIKRDKRTDGPLANGLGGMLQSITEHRYKFMCECSP